MKSRFICFALMSLPGFTSLIANAQNSKTLASAQQASLQNSLAVIAYYTGDSKTIDSYPVEKLTHIIFSFCHLSGNKIVADNKEDSNTIHHLVTLKKRNPFLKVLVSLGGWGGCKDCSPVFSTTDGRNEFAVSVKTLLQYFKIDGIDIDWEYPVIPGYPGHAHSGADKSNFTALMQTLRAALGTTYEINFAAGGFKNYFDSSVDWQKVMPIVNKVNLMTYDLVHGYSTVTGHHTPLYSTAYQQSSTDFAVHYLDSIGVPKNKIVIGAAFYGRIFETTGETGNGLYKPGKFVNGIAYKELEKLSPADGFSYLWDDEAKAPYIINASKRLVVTYDNFQSVQLKTAYAIKQKLSGIMFWELSEDKTSNGLLNAIYATKINQSLR